MIPQYVAAALVSENKALCHPASVDSIPTSAGQEDHVSMGNAAGLKALQVVANAERVLAIELLAGAQAVEFLAPLEPGVGVRAARAFVRTLSRAASARTGRCPRTSSASRRRSAMAVSSSAVERATSRRPWRERPAAAPAPVSRLPPSFTRSSRVVILVVAAISGGNLLEGVRRRGRVLRRRDGLELVPVPPARVPEGAGRDPVATEQSDV